MRPVGFTRRVTVLMVGALLAFAAHARQGELPYSLAHRAKAGVILPIEDVRPIDAATERAAVDAHARQVGPHTKRLQVAVDNPVAIDPSRSGVWDTLADGSRLWRVRLRAAGATDLRLGFARYALPAGATLYVIGADDYYQGPYTAADAMDARFNAPVVPGDIATVEVRVPAGAMFSSDALELGSVGAGFRDVFGREKTDSRDLGTSGACNVNVVCPLGQAYLDDIRAVGQYEYQADDNRRYYLCTGTLVANVPHDHKNYFMTAAHCITSNTEAASMVVYWNYQSTQCNQLSAPAGGFFNDNQQGAVLRATRADVDFSLVELSQTPDPAWHLYYAGWDASGATPAATIGIHHPLGDVKKITAGPAPTTTDSCISGSPTAANTHWATGPYTQGTTENGSSGSGLFVASASGYPHARLLTGTLSGGDAACSSVSPSQPNAGTDCYGKLAVAWDGASAATRLRDWLDPAHTGTTLLEGAEDSPPLVIPRHSTRPIPAILLYRRQR
jgi:hypothetical protein